MFKVIYFVYRYRAAEFIAADPLHDGIPQTSQFAVEPGLVATGPILLGLFFFPFAAVLNIDMEHEFQARILAYAAVDDCGTVLNPKIVEGQAFGGTAHGIGAALMESFDYDEDGNLLTATFSDYCPITSMNMPQIAHANIESPSPFTFNGAKGMGESAGAPLDAISGAIEDAVYSEGFIVTDSHHSPPAIYRMLGDGPNRDQLVSRKSR